MRENFSEAEYRVLLLKTWKKYLFNIGKLCIFFGALGFVRCEVYAAQTLDVGDISDSYSDCTFKDNNNGTSTVSTVVNYKPIKNACWSFGCGYQFLGRALIVYSYDKNGKPNASSFAASSVKLNGVEYYDRYVGVGYSLYQNSKHTPPWNTMTAFSATFVAVIPNSNLSAWPAISLHAANMGTTGKNNDMAEIKGAAYIARSSSNDGSCKVLANPEAPPPLDIEITVSAPDWDLGELQQGLSTTQLGRADQMLCFSYDAASVQSQKFIIAASNTNGVLNNRYQLRHLSDTSQVVPYSLTLLMLNGGGSSVQLPGNSTALPLASGDRSCYLPTFTTEVGKTVKEGDYSDVLTFTVITNP